MQAKRIESSSQSETNLEHLQEVVFAHFKADKRLLLLDRILGARFQAFIVARRDKSIMFQRDQELVNDEGENTCLIQPVSYRSSFMAIS